MIAKAPRAASTSLRGSLARHFRFVTAGAPLLVVLAAGSPAFAQDPAAAQVLFDEAKRLMAQDHYAEACPKLEESERLDPGIGTKFNLASCYQHVGRNASAWALFLEAAADAKAAGDRARTNAARSRATALEPILSRLIVVARPETTPGLSLSRDGEPFGRAQWGVAIPVDAGRHELIASAPHRRTWHTTVVVPTTGKVIAVQVPALDDDTPPPQAQALVLKPVPAANVTAPQLVRREVVPAESNGTGNGQRVAAIILGVTGLAAMGVGSVFAVESKQNKDDSSPHCAGNTCDATGVSQRDDAIRDGNVATIALGAGAAALLGAAIVWLSAPSDSGHPRTARSTTIRALPMTGGGLRGLALGGSF